jgi:uncharacterized protein
VPGSNSLRVVLFGGSGQIGQILARHFQTQNRRVTVVSRRAGAAAWRTISWDARTLGPWSSELEGADVVINLAGRSVNCRYNSAHRREIKESRIQTTRLIGQAISMLSKPPPLWMNASTATIYRHAFDRPMDEDAGEIGGNEPDAPSRWRFSIDVATSWEQSFFDARTPGTRKVALRTSMLMSPDRGGIFDVLLGLVRRGLGGPSGSGDQFVSWIHDVDFATAIDFLILHENLNGCINLTAPNPLPNREFMAALRRAWGITIGLPAAKWMLEIGSIFLRTETELVLKSRRVVPKRLLEGGFAFEFPEWSAAALNLVARWRAAQRHG